MTTTTDTTTTVDPARGDLVLVTISESYARSWEGPRVLRERDSSDDERTFYATRDDGSPSDYVTLIVPETDERSRDMWALNGSTYGLELEGPYRGWSVLKSNVTAVPTAVPTTRPRPASADLSEQDRRALPISEAYPVGSVWRHRSYADPVTIVTHLDMFTVRITGPGVDDADNRDWPRGALDAYGTFVGWADDQDTTAEDTTTTAETFTRADVDRMVREARETAKREADAALEEFKRAANARAVEYAENNGLCSEFERCMDDIGLLGREEWHDAHDETYRVRFTVYVDVTARDDEQAEDRARDDLLGALDYYSGLRDTVEHHSTDTL